VQTAERRGGAEYRQIGGSERIVNGTFEQPAFLN
jgi:hypothetical protein